MKKIFLVIIVFFIVGCNKKNNFHEDILFAFNTNISISLYEGTEEDLENVKDIFYLYNDLTNFKSEVKDMNNIYKINNSAYEEEVSLQNELFTLIKESIRYYNYTNGYFNIAIGAASFEWKNALENNTYIDLSSYLDKININDIVLNEENKTIRFLNRDIKIDLGGIAKGYALEEVRKYLESNSIEKYLINAGESSVLLGNHYDNRDFRIGLVNPENTNEVYKTIESSNNCVTTSGDYQNYIEYNDTRYHHILNPKTLSNPTYYRSITLIGENASKLDALSTALFSMEYDEAKELVESSNIKAIFYISSSDIREVN